jgi:hypothetical protein
MDFGVSLVKADCHPLKQQITQIVQSSSKPDLSSCFEAITLGASSYEYKSCQDIHFFRAERCVMTTIIDSHISLLAGSQIPRADVLLRKRTCYCLFLSFESCLSYVN